MSGHQPSWHFKVKIEYRFYLRCHIYPASVSPSIMSLTGSLFTTNLWKTADPGLQSAVLSLIHTWNQFCSRECLRSCCTCPSTMGSAKSLQVESWIHYGIGLTFICLRM